MHGLQKIKCITCCTIAIWTIAYLFSCFIYTFNPIMSIGDIYLDFTLVNIYMHIRLY